MSTLNLSSYPNFQSCSSLTFYISGKEHKYPYNLYIQNLDVIFDFSICLTPTHQNILITLPSQIYANSIPIPTLIQAATDQDYSASPLTGLTVLLLAHSMSILLQHQGNLLKS